MSTAILEVECYSGYRDDELPRRFRLGTRQVEVAEIIDRWLDPRCRYFKLRGDDGGVYILRHDAATGDWEMTLYQGPVPPGERLSSS